MFAELAFGAAVETAAAVASEMIDRDNAAAEVTERGGLDVPAFEQVEPGGDRAGGHEPGRPERNRLRREAHAVAVSALRPGGDGRHRHVLDAGIAEQRPALIGLAAESRQLACCEGSYGIVQVQPRPGNVLRMAPNVVTAEKITADDDREDDQPAGQLAD